MKKNIIFGTLILLAFIIIASIAMSSEKRSNFILYSVVVYIIYIVPIFLNSTRHK